ncbi:phage tail protein [Brucella intermedia]|uniref:phage tail protein n=1 Tax=Brucella intermedia TaxID=94625 RepID=UPI0023631376|nr:phage tail protein [Brucella intermedia]
MAYTMMGLGPFRFSIDTAAYQTLTRKSEYRWESQERIGRHPAMQFIGAGHETFTLEGTVYPHWRSGFGQVEEMRGIAGQGSPLMLVSGTGRVFGRFVITEVEERQTYFHPNGAPRKQEFTLELKSYGEDGEGPNNG